MARTRKEYAQLLVDSVEKTIRESPENIEASEAFGEPCLSQKWGDIALLCEVVRQDIINKPD